MNKLSNLFFFLLLIFGSYGCVDDIKGSVNGNVYTGETSISLDVGESIMLGQGSKYSYILEHVWNVVKENPSVNKVDINLIISGDDGYGNKKIANWCHLIFNDAVIEQLKKYSDLGKMTWSEKSSLLDFVGMSKLKDYKGDLSKEVFE
jgi:hypothetical protein